jgi:phospholipase C
MALDNGDGQIGNYHAFRQQLTSGDLPDFSYLEPFWGGGYGSPLGDDFIGLQGNDYHSPAWVGPAEYDLNELYNELRASPDWEHMLFVITFDEHGGTWDHVPPPVTVKPDNFPSIRPFGFTRMGVRVPTILVSPWVAPGTVFRAPNGSKFDFDHTSLLATILRWAGIDPGTAKLGTRVATAPTFEHVLSTTPYDNSPTFVVPQEYATQGGQKGPHNIPFDIGGVPTSTIRSLMDAASSVDQFLEVLQMVANRL